MPSPQHEMLVELIRKNPRLLLPFLRERLPGLPSLDLRLYPGESATSKLPPLRADLTLDLFTPGTEDPFAGLTIEVQLGKNDDKPYSWHMYQAGQHHRLRVPTYLLVITIDPEIAEWAAGPFDTGQTILRPWVVAPADVPVIIDPAHAVRALDLTLLSGIVHSREPVAVPIGLALAHALRVNQDDDLGLFYWDALMAALSPAMRRSIQMELRNFQPRSEWGKEILADGIAQGKAEGMAKGKAESILTALDTRGILIDDLTRRQIITCTDLSQLEAWFRRSITAASLDEMLRAHPSSALACPG